MYSVPYNEIEEICLISLHSGSIFVVFVNGLLISFFGFAARKAISATAFTVTGVLNKFLALAINVLIWDKHANLFGLVCLLLTIVGGVLYQQSVTGVSYAPAPQHLEPKNANDDGCTDDEDV